MAKGKTGKGKKKVEGDEVVVKHRDHKGQPTERTFSREVHGEKFADLADEFKKTNANSIIADELEPEETDEESEDTEDTDEESEDSADEE